jgi:hypothetical protein
MITVTTKRASAAKYSAITVKTASPPYSYKVFSPKSLLTGLNNSKSSSLASEIPAVSNAIFQKAYIFQAVYED